MWWDGKVRTTRKIDYNYAKSWGRPARYLPQLQTEYYYLAMNKMPRGFGCSKLNDSHWGNGFMSTVLFFKSLLTKVLTLYFKHPQMACTYNVPIYYCCIRNNYWFTFKNYSWVIFIYTNIANMSEQGYNYILAFFFYINKFLHHRMVLI